MRNNNAKTHYVNDGKFNQLDRHGDLFRTIAVLKASVRYFLSNFYFSPNDSPSKTMKNVFYFI